MARAEVTSESDIVRGEVTRLRVREVPLPNVRGTPVVARKGGQVWIQVQGMSKLQRSTQVQGRQILAECTLLTLLTIISCEVGVPLEGAGQVSRPFVDRVEPAR